MDFQWSADGFFAKYVLIYLYLDDLSGFSSTYLEIRLIET